MRLRRVHGWEGVDGEVGVIYEGDGFRVEVRIAASVWAADAEGALAAAKVAAAAEIERVRGEPGGSHWRIPETLSTRVPPS